MRGCRGGRLSFVFRCSSSPPSPPQTRTPHRLSPAFYPSNFPAAAAAAAFTPLMARKGAFVVPPARWPQPPCLPHVVLLSAPFSAPSHLFLAAPSHTACVGPRTPPSGACLHPTPHPKAATRFSVTTHAALAAARRLRGAPACCALALAYGNPPSPFPLRARARRRRPVLLRRPFCSGGGDAAAAARRAPYPPAASRQPPAQRGLLGSNTPHAPCLLAAGAPAALSSSVLSPSSRFDSSSPASPLLFCFASSAPHPS